MIFKDRGNHSVACLAYLQEIKTVNPLKREIMGAIRTENPAVREKVPWKNSAKKQLNNN